MGAELVAAGNSAPSPWQVGSPEVLGTTRSLLCRAWLPEPSANSCTGASTAHRHPPNSLTHRLQPQAARRRLWLPCCILLLLHAMRLPQHDRLQGAFWVTALKEDGADCVLQALLYTAVLCHLGPQRRHLQTGRGHALQGLALPDGALPKQHSAWPPAGEMDWRAAGHSETPTRSLR